ncbi:MAG: fumarylacetoacetate hydrolase family protein [Hyphomonadaceae bacterium]|nr:fumarylacetoacetate hydrolase family protein [Hyphomonadaceae bacterium]
MKFISYSVGGVDSFGVVVDGGVIDLKARSGAANLKALIADGLEGVAGMIEGAKPDHALADVIYLPVITDPGKIICVGLNYEEHRIETGRAKADHPTIFTRFADTQVGHMQSIIKPGFSDMVDYEGELALVISKGGRFISEADALGHVAGFACYNDATVRDFQRHTTQFTPGKNFPCTGGFGPFLVTPDEVGPLGEQRIQTRLNGQVVQDAHLDQMIFPVTRLIAYTSTWTNLSPGDVIVTGTPGGVGMKRNPPLYMKAGDEIVIEIEKVGKLVNTVSE